MSFTLCFDLNAMETQELLLLLAISNFSIANRNRKWFIGMNAKIFCDFFLEDGIGSMDAAVKGTISIIPDKEVVLLTLSGLSAAQIFSELIAESLFNQYLNE